MPESNSTGSTSTVTCNDLRLSSAVTRPSSSSWSGASDNSAGRSSSTSVRISASAPRVSWRSRSSRGRSGESVAGLAQQAVGGQRRGPQRLVDGVVQLAGESLTLLGGGQPRDLAGETGVGDRGGGLVGDGTETVAVAVGEEALHRALGDEETDLLVADAHRRTDHRLRRAECTSRIVDDDRADPGGQTHDDIERRPAHR